VDTVEEEAQALRSEVEVQKEKRREVEQRVDEQNREVARLEGEISRLKEEHAHEVLKVRNTAREEHKSVDHAREEMLRSQDLFRDKAAEHALLQERNEDLMRQLSTMEN